MIADLKPYADCKESGLPWLGRVPGHWVTKRGKSYLVSIDERSKAGREELLTVSSARGVVPRSSASVTMFKAESYVGHKLCWPGDLVINSLWAWAGGLGVSHHHGIISTAYSVYRSRPSAQINPQFLHELVRSSAFRWELQVRSKGVWISRLQLSDTAFLDAPIPLPPPDEQAAIVRFLDWANGRLERAIRAKRRVIALLNEQKQAIIHRAVTRGLDPSVPLKPSGVPWLGDIPQHWEVVPSKALFKHRREKAREGDEMLTASQAHGIVSRATFMAIEGRRVMQVITGADILKHVEPNDFVMSMRSFQGGLEWSQVSGAISSAYVMLVPTESVYPRYFAHALKSCFYISDLRRTSDLVRDGQALRYANFGQVSLPLIHIAEQQAIADFIDRSAAEIVRATTRLEREIELLREYHTRLVADVVTGKLDVREAAMHLPDEGPLHTIMGDAGLSDETDTSDEEAVV